jgi:RNA polymerase sigma-70 factor (ECF subfamily)
MSEAETDLRVLVERARTGDAAALDRLLRVLEPQIWRFGLRLCGDREDARDVLQDTLLGAVRTLGEFRGEAALSTWLYTIARSHCIKKRRRPKGAPANLVSLDADSGEAGRGLADSASGPAEQAERAELGRLLERALATLPPAFREAVVLRDLEGLSAPEAAAVLGVSVAAVKSRLHRGRTALKEAFTSLVDGELRALGVQPG